MSELRLYAITSKEVLKKINGNRGKLVAQAAHAFLHAFWDAEQFIPDVAREYQFGDQSAVKICLVVDTDQELLDIFDKFEAAEKIHGLTKVIDQGRTVFNGEPTLTFIGVGPITKEDFEAVSPGLKLLL